MNKLQKILKKTKHFEILFRDKGDLIATESNLTEMMRGVVFKINDIIDALNNNESIHLESIKSSNQYNNESLVNFFINRLFGDCEVSISIHDEKSGSHYSYSIKEILGEFAEIIQANELVENFNPRTKEFVLIDKSKAQIISSNKNPFFAKENE